ncbi:ThiJ/PfpI family protein [Cordyceps militaris]|uniref:ThiJ/PfpI family protein n=1 Tax=Cordyceps militaris TaxID=73501 RepID=A0A2H4SWA6_CORMI|nr:ThiJ/PfpI family protein [Cordyceps militaris]
MAKVVFLMADYGHDPSGELSTGNSLARPLISSYRDGRALYRVQGSWISHYIRHRNWKRSTMRHQDARGHYPSYSRAPSPPSPTKCGTYIKRRAPKGPSSRSTRPWPRPPSGPPPHLGPTPPSPSPRYDLVFLPGGHDKGVRQVIDADAVHALLATYFPQTKKPSKKAVGAVCHGVMVLSETKSSDGTSVLHGVTTTALPTRFEQLAFWGTRLFLGDYYKTYGAGSDNVEESVTKVLEKPQDFKNSLAPAPFVVEDDKYNYISARFPGDVDLLGEKLVALVKSNTA